MRPDKRSKPAIEINNDAAFEARMQAGKRFYETTSFDHLPPADGPDGYFAITGDDDPGDRPDDDDPGEDSPNEGAPVEDDSNEDEPG